MSTKACATALALAGGVALSQTPAVAQQVYAVNVGNITSTQSCEYFRNYEGSRLTVSEAEYARVWGAAAARSYYATHTTWRSYVVKDCQENFQTLRNSLTAALASTGRLTSGPSGYTLNVTISDIGQTPPAQPKPVRGNNSYQTSWGTALATVSFTLLDSSGSTVDGGVFTKKIEMSRTLNTNRMNVRVSEPAASVYDLIQQEVSLAIARDVSFAVDPLRVIAVEDDLIEVNYGRPLLKIGDRLDVKMTGRIGALRYRVTKASENDAIAMMDGDNDPSSIQPGNQVTFIEADSDAANGRRFRRKRLP